MSLTKVTNSMISGAVLNVLDYGAATTNTAAQNVTAFQAALNAANAMGGATVSVPKGTYLLNADLQIYANTILQGQGQEISKLSFSHTGNGVKSLFTINSSTAANIKVLQIALVCTNPANTGGGFFDLCGTYISIRDCFIQGWAYGIIFDQTEVSDIQTNNIVGNSVGQIWLVDGPDYTPGVLLGFTNGIIIYGNQLNALASADLIIDDGYVNHYIAANNLNGGRHGIRAHRAAVCNIVGNNFESNASYSIFFATTNSKGNVPVILNPDASKTNSNVFINGNLIANAADAPVIYLSNITSATIENNSFYAPQCTTNLIEFDSPNSALQVTIQNNNKNFSQKPWFNSGIFGGLAERLNYLTQLEYTRCQTAVSGQATDTPDSMQGIYIGSKLWVVNTDGTNGELVTVESATSATFVTTYTTAKSNPHNVTVIDNSNITGTLDNTGTPAVYLSTPAKSFVTSGTTAITNFTAGSQGQIFTIVAKHSLTITNGASILLAGGVNFAMTAEDTLTLILRPDIVAGAKWAEVSRSVN
jgi:hypothetical protein